MPALQFSAAMLTSLLNGGQADNAAKSTDNGGKNTGKDQFSSLLDVVGNISDTGSTQNNSKKDDDKTPVAAAIDVPAPFKDNARKDDDKKPASVDNSKPDNTAKPAAKARDDADDDSKKTNAANDDDSAAPVQKTVNPKILKADKADKASSDDKADASDDVADLKAKISDRVDNLAELMNIIARLLAGAGAVTTAADITGPVNAAADDIAASAATKAVSDPFAVFSDLKNTLAQLQQFLQKANGQDASLSDDQLATLNSINTALASELDALKSLLPQNATGENRQSLLDILQAQPDTQQPVNANANAQNDVTDVKSLLQNDISLIKDALQKFKNSSDASQGKQQPVSHNIIQPLITDAQNKQPAPQDSIRQDNSPAPSAIILPAAVQSDAQAAQQTQQQNNQIVFQAAASIHAQAQGAETETNTGGNSGQGGGQQPQITIGGIGATQANTTDKAAGSQFSSLLNRAIQTPVTEQVAFQIKSAIGSGNSKISIQLHPEDLGKLDITLDVDSKGKTGVTVTADNKQTLDLLQRDSQGLQKALADAGLKTDAGSLSFNLRGGEREGQGSQNQSQAASQYQKSQPDDAQGEINIAQVAAVTRSYTLTLPDGLDIKI